MNVAKNWSILWVVLGFVLNGLQIVAPVLPPVWGDLVTAILAVLATYHIYQSHTPTALGAAGYIKN